MTKEIEPFILYLSGPMTGYDNLNFDQFHEYAQELRDKGYVVLNPAETAGGYKDLDDEWFLEHDIHMVSMADAVAVLPGWKESEGSCLEVHVAKKLGKPIVDAGDPTLESIDVQFTPVIGESDDESQ